MNPKLIYFSSASAVFSNCVRIRSYFLDSFLGHVGLAAGAIGEAWGGADGRVCGEGRRPGRLFAIRLLVAWRPMVAYAPGAVDERLINSAVKLLNTTRSCSEMHGLLVGWYARLLAGGIAGGGGRRCCLGGWRRAGGTGLCECVRVVCAVFCFLS